MRVLYHDIQRLPEDVEAATGARHVPLDELLASADFVSPPRQPDGGHPPPHRRPALARMRPTAVLVNTSRGPVVDTDALAAALRDGTIWAAALDVTDPEPLPADHPLVDAWTTASSCPTSPPRRVTRVG